MKIVIALLLHFFLSVFFNNPAFANVCIDNKKYEETLAKATYIGLVKIEKYLGPCERLGVQLPRKRKWWEREDEGADNICLVQPLVVISPLRSYKGNIPPLLEVEDMWDNCLDPDFKAGQIREIILHQVKDKNYFVKMRDGISHEMWDRFRKEHGTLELLSCKNSKQTAILPYGGIAQCQEIVIGK